MADPPRYSGTSRWQKVVGMIGLVVVWALASECSVPAVVATAMVGTHRV